MKAQGFFAAPACNISYFYCIHRITIMQREIKANIRHWHELNQYVNSCKSKSSHSKCYLSSISPLHCLLKPKHLANHFTTQSTDFLDRPPAKDLQW